MQRSASLMDLTSEAFRRMGAFLFRPFRWGVWWRLAIILMFAGQVFSGCSGAPNLNLNSPSERASQRRAETAAKADAKDSAAARPPTYRDLEKGWFRLGLWARRHRAQIPVLIAGALLLLAAISGFFCWLSARFSFVLLHVLRTGQVGIRIVFGMHRELANSYAGWLFASSMAGFALGVGPFAGVLLGWKTVLSQHPDAPLWDVFKDNLAITLGPLLGAVGFLIALGIVSGLLAVWQTDYVAPIMMARGEKVLAAWRECLRILGRSWLEGAKYLIWRALLSSVLVIATGIARLVFVLGVVLVGIVLALIGVLIAGVVPIAKPVMIGIGVAAIILFGVMSAVVGLMISVPASITLRLFSLRYLESLGEGLTLLPPEGQE